MCKPNSYFICNFAQRFTISKHHTKHITLHHSLQVMLYSMYLILLRGIQFTQVQRHRLNGISVFFFTIHEANTCVALPKACRSSVRALSYSDITTIWIRSYGWKVEQTWIEQAHVLNERHIVYCTAFVLRWSLPYRVQPIVRK
jgi:hypothetical protein